MGRRPARGDRSAGVRDQLAEHLHGARAGGVAADPRRGARPDRGRVRAAAARGGHAAPAGRGRRLRRLLRLARPRDQRRQDVPARLRAAHPQLAPPPDRLPRPRGHDRGVRDAGHPAQRPAQGARRAGPDVRRVRRLDIEAELGFVVGAPSELGCAVPVTALADHVFGVTGLNDWSARDLQAWEYVPLGPFLGKSFATSISPWVTPLAALDAAWVDLPGQDPEPLPYLGPGADARASTSTIEVELNGEVVSRPPYRTMYWSPAQMLAHMTVNGASLRTGDLFASGTVSGPEPGQRGSFLELSWGGKEPFEHGDGRATPSSRTATRSCSATPPPAPAAAGSRSARSPDGSSLRPRRDGLSAVASPASTDHADHARLHRQRLGRTPHRRPSRMACDGATAARSTMRKAPDPGPRDRASPYGPPAERSRRPGATGHRTDLHGGSSVTPSWQARGCTSTRAVVRPRGAGWGSDASPSGRARRAPSTTSGVPFRLRAGLTGVPEHRSQDRTCSSSAYALRMGLLTPLAIRIGAIPWMPKLLPQIVWFDTRLHRVTRGRVTVLDIAGLPDLNLTVTGKKSGIERTTPLLCVPDGDTILIAGSYFGGPKTPLWVGNLRAADGRRRSPTAGSPSGSTPPSSRVPIVPRPGRRCSRPGPTTRSTRSAPTG